MKNRGLKRRLLGIILGSAMALIWNTANAEEGESTTLDTVTVTAERFPVKEKESTRFVTVVSSEELKETGANNLVDALRRIGGLGYTANAPLGMSNGGMNSKLIIRGIEGGELVLVNGLPVQGAGGRGYDLSSIPVDQIERVEILKGAASTLYGADAMTGVINIITKKPTDETQVKASVEFGNRYYTNDSISCSLPKVTFGLNYRHLGTLDRISESFTKGTHYDLEPTNELALNMNANPFGDFYIDYLGSYYKTEFKNIYDSGKPFVGTKQKKYSNFFDLRYDTRDLQLKAFGTFEETLRDVYTSSDPESRDENYNFGLDGSYRFDLPILELSVGGEYVYRGADYSTKWGEHHRSDYALFAQLKKDFFDRLIITVGAREQFIDAESGSENHNKFLPSFGANYTATGYLNLFANAGKAFRMPTFNDLYYESSWMIPNPDLKPEEGWTYGAGVKLDTTPVSLRLAGFYMTYEDKIEIDRSQGYPLKRFNAGDYSTKGIEWNLGLYPFANQAGFVKDIAFQAAGYWADPTAKDPNGEEYQPGPKFETSLAITYLTQPLTLDLNCQILADREEDLESYAVLNFYGKYRVWKGYITFGVDNIFNQQDIQISGNMEPDASNQYVYYEVGRMVKIGYEIVF